MISSRGSNLHFLPAAFDCFHSSLDSFINSHTHASTHTQIHTHADRVGRTHLKQVDCLACVWCESGVGDSAQVREKERKKERETVRQWEREFGRGKGQYATARESKQIRKLQQVDLFFLRGAHRAYAQCACSVISGQLTADTGNGSGEGWAGQGRLEREDNAKPAWAVFYLINELARLPIVRLT